MGLSSIPQRIRSLPRLPQIVRVLVKYGFGDVVSRVGLDSAVHSVKARFFTDLDPRFTGVATEERIRLALEELGPTFIKLGQVIATRPDLVPMSLVFELRKLQDKVKPFDTEGIRGLVEAELGRPLDEVFSAFDAEPLAAASIAQVHTAVLKDGRRVVLKIQRPNLERVIETDLTLLYWLAEMAEEQLPEVRRYSPMDLVTEFHTSITKEIDFETEAYHIRRFAQNFEGDPDIYVPAVIDELTTSRILCEEFIDGVKLNDPTLHDRPDVDCVRVAKAGIRLILEQALKHGFFHADPHPGNVFVVPENRLCFIDYGMMGALDQEQIDDLLTFLVAILTRDLDKLVGLLRRKELLGEEVDVTALRRDVDDLIARFESVPLERLNIGRYLQRLFEVIVRHDVRIPSDLLLVNKALATIEGVGRDLYPELNPLEEVRPIILKIYLGRLTDPSYYGRGPRRLVEDLLHLAETAPRDLHLTLRKLRQGRIHLEVKLDEFQTAIKSRARSTNRLALGVIIGALTWSSAFLFSQADLSSWVGDFPLGAVVGLVGLVLSSFLGLVLVVGFIRSGGL